MKILVVRFSSIGDIVLTTPVLRCIKQQLQGTELHFLCKKQFRFLVESNPYIDKVYLLEKNTGDLLRELKQESYDYLIDLHHNLRTLRLKARLGVKTLSFDKLNYKKWLRVNLKVDILPRIHIVDRYLETVKSLGVKNDHKGLDYFIPEKDRVNAKKEFPAKIINACGKYNLHQSACFVEQSEKVISSDTGLMHIAAAFKKQIISIWGNTIPEFGMYPYMPGQGSRIVEVRDLDCRPCSKLGYKKCPKGHFKCMNETDMRQVF